MRGTGRSYGGRGRKFLYGAEAEGTRAVNLRAGDCWKPRLTGPAKDSPYAGVLLWVDKDSGAIKGMEG